MHYVATNDCYVRHFRAKRQAISTYSSGFINRARSLSNAYCLNNISFKKNDVVVDCGANVGDLELYFRIFTPGVVYHAVELSPSEYHCLEKNILWPHQSPII